MAPPGRVGRLSVSLAAPGGDVPVGTLAWSGADRVAAFEYADTFAAGDVELSPFHLKRGPGVRLAPRDPFDGLHGLFADSLPDGWGRLLVDRRVASLGGEPRLLSPLDRLAIVGSRGMGALVFRPETFEPLASGGVDLDALARQVALVRDQGVADVETLLAANGGSAGARGKIMILRDRVTGMSRLDTGVAPTASEDAWLVKFRARGDVEAIGRVEHAYAVMARAADLDIPETTVLQTASGSAYFAARRFDRDGTTRRHVHSLAGLLQADFRTPSIDYDDFLKATRIVTGRAADVDEAFRRMVFNVLSGNRDDHAKNHAFIMGADGTWRLSPAYDLTPSEGPGGEHSLAIAGEGGRPLRAHMMRAAERASIKRSRAETMIATVADAIGAFAIHAEAAGLDENTMDRLRRDLANTTARTLGSL